jgi:surface antigen
MRNDTGKRVAVLLLACMLSAGALNATANPGLSRPPESDQAVPRQALFGYCNSADWLRAIGAALGGFIGRQIADGGVLGTALGAAIGGALGTRIGRELDAADRACIGDSLERAATRQSVRWVNSDSGVAYSITPAVAARDADGRICRDFELVSTYAGRSDVARGTACRDRDQVWTVVPEQTSLL